MTNNTYVKNTEDDFCTYLFCGDAVYALSIFQPRRGRKQTSRRFKSAIQSLCSIKLETQRRMCWTSRTFQISTHIIFEGVWWV